MGLPPSGNTAAVSITTVEFEVDVFEVDVLWLGSLTFLIVGSFCFFSGGWGTGVDWGGESCLEIVRTERSPAVETLGVEGLSPTTSWDTSSVLGISFGLFLAAGTSVVLSTFVLRLAPPLTDVVAEAFPFAFEPLTVGFGSVGI